MDFEFWTVDVHIVNDSRSHWICLRLEIDGIYGLGSNSNRNDGYIYVVGPTIISNELL